jgi:predicted DCC family thiol-disulfide oxidoreductase YuxK
LKTQVSAVYGFAALSKLNREYLAGITVGAYVSPAVLAPLPDPLRTAVLLGWSWSSIALELFLAGALWIAPLQPMAFLAGLMLHTAMVLLLPPRLGFQLAIFAIEMFALYLVFLAAPPRSRTVVWDDRCGFCEAVVRWIRRLDWLGVHSFGRAAESAPPAEGGGGIQVLTPAAHHAEIQVLTPAGHYAGFAAIRSMLEVLPVSFLWAPLGRLPLIRALGERAYQAVARRARS